MPPSDQKTRLLPLHDSAPPESDAPPVSAEVSVRAKYAWLTVYFALNLALTLYNKAVMGKVAAKDPLPLPICPPLPSVDTPR